MPTIVLNKDSMRQMLDIGEVIDAVEQAFRYAAEGRAVMPPKAYLELEEGDFRAMPAALPGAVGVKWVNVHTRNPDRGLPTVMAVMIYSDPETGYPLALMDATDITAYRTGAAAAIASRYLARRDSQSLGIIGAGRQAHTQISAHARLFDFKEIRVFDLSEEAVDRMNRDLPGYPVKGCSIEETAASDILCTLTPSNSPVVKNEWILPGTHINAVGADAEGKQELEPEILKRAVVVVDDIRQASMAGEINVPVRKKLYGIDEVHGALGEIITGKKAGRTGADAVTVFDSTGLAIEDIAVAKLLFEKAKRTGNYLTINLV